MKQNVYEIEKNVEKILRGDATGFLNKKLSYDVQMRLKKFDFKVFSPFEEAEKVVLYANECPKVRLFKICCYKDDIINHSSVMGSLFGLNITNEKFGDIVKWQNDFYIYLLNDICDLVIDELRMIGSVPVSLKEVSGDLLCNFEREYEKIELIVSSLRIDTVISKLIGCNRDLVSEKVKGQDVFLNDVVVKKASNVFEVGDVFSVRRCGKFKFRKIIGRTKKDNYIIEIDKYV